MDKNLLQNIAKNLRSLADSLTAVINAMADEKTTGSPAPTQPESVSFEEVQAVLVGKSRAGHTDKVRDLLAKYGAKKLSEVDPAHYAALMAEGKKL